MDEGITMSTRQDPQRMQFSVVATFDDAITQRAPVLVFEEIVRRIAARYVEENYAAIAAKIDQQAIANLAVAQAGKTLAGSIDLNTQAVVADVLNKVRPRRW